MGQRDDGEQREGLRVLIVEDDFLVSEMIKGLLHEMGYIVVGEAGNGSEAVEMACTLRPDVVLMDLMMTEMDGFEATRLIQETCPVAVVALTAHNAPELIEQASEVGIGAYVLKPPGRRDLERAVDRALVRFQIAEP